MQFSIATLYRFCKTDDDGLLKDCGCGEYLPARDLCAFKPPQKIKKRKSKEDCELDRQECLKSSEDAFSTCQAKVNVNLAAVLAICAAGAVAGPFGIALGIACALVVAKASRKDLNTCQTAAKDRRAACRATFDNCLKGK